MSVRTGQLASLQKLARDDLKMLWEIQYTLRDNFSTDYLSNADGEAIIPSINEMRLLVDKTIDELSKLDATLTELLKKYSDELYK